MPKAARDNNTKPPELRAFIELVMAPLTGEEEPVDSPAFLRQIRLDMKRVWDSAIQRVRLAEANHKVRIMRLLITDSDFGAEDYASAAVVHRARAAQCLIPAPTAKELRWKKRVMKWRAQLPEGVEQAIALDQKRLAGDAA